MNNSILITGITGQVGSQLADYVLDNTNLDVIGLMRWQEPMDNLYHLTSRINNNDKIFIEYGDLNDYASIYNVILKKAKIYISSCSTILSKTS